MQIVNIAVFFKDKALKVRFDIIEERGGVDSDDDVVTLYFESLRFLTDLEFMALSAVSMDERVSDYAESLKYALTINSDTPITLKTSIVGSDSLTYFNPSHNTKEVELLERGETSLHAHQVVTYTIPPSLPYIINFLSCLTIYFEFCTPPDFRIVSTNCDFDPSPYSNSFKDDILQSEAIQTLMEKMLDVGSRGEIELGYQPVMKALQEVSNSYQEGKLHDKNYTLLDYCQKNFDVKMLKQNFADIKQLFTDFNSDNSAITLAKIKSIKKFFASYPKIDPLELLNRCIFIFDYHTQFKNNLIYFAYGFTPDVLQGGVSKENKDIPIMLLIKYAQFKLNPDGTIKIINLDNNISYNNLYEIGRKFHQNFKTDLSLLGEKLGGKVEVNDNEIIFSRECTPKLIELSFISGELFKHYFYAYNRVSFFAHSQHSTKDSNLFRALPSEILTKIVQLSEDRFSILPDGFFNQAIKHEHARMEEINPTPKC